MWQWKVHLTTQWQEVGQRERVHACVRERERERRGVGSLVQSQLVSMEFFIDNLSDRTVTLGSTQPLTEMSTRSISWGKRSQCRRLTT